MNIDTRYPPQPDNLKVLLYPLQGTLNLRSLFATNSIAKLRSRISTSLACPEDSCILASMGRTILAHFLKWMQSDAGRQLVVAIPAFYCPHTCHEILATGIRIVFVDIESDFRITKSGLDFALASKCDVIIWPDLFVGCNVLPEILEMNSQILVIRDIAHTFPYTKPTFGIYQNRVVTLFSFGPNKPLFGIGGGGITICDTSIRTKFLKYWDSNHAPTHAVSVCFNQLLISFRMFLRKKVPVLAAEIGLLPQLYSDQRELLEATLKHEAKGQGVQASDMTPWQAAVALDHWGRAEAVDVERKVFIDRLIKISEDRFGLESVKHLRNAEYIGVFVIRIGSLQRYALSELLARQGMQTTWYYYPLTQLSLFSDCKRQSTPGTEQLAREALVLPCYWPNIENGNGSLIEKIMLSAVTSPLG